MTGEELFKGEDSLNVKVLKKLEKDDIQAAIELNLQNLNDYYYQEFYKKSERKWQDNMLALVLSKKYFLKPLTKIIKANNIDIPAGFAYMLENMRRISLYAFMNAIKTENESNKPDAEKAENIQEMKEAYNEKGAELTEVIMLLNQKTIKKLKDIGFSGHFASMIAPALFPASEMNRYNVNRFVNILTSTLYEVYKVSLDEDSHTTAGADLSSTKVINKVMNLITKNMSIEDYAMFISTICLEKQDKKFDALNIEQMKVYAAISSYALGVLEDKDTFSKKMRSNIIRECLKVRTIESKREGGDIPRRVTFTKLDENLYPRLVKAVKKLGE